MGIYWPRDGGRAEVTYTYDGVPIDMLDAPTLRAALRGFMDLQARYLTEIYGMACSCEEPQPHTRPSGLVICKACGGKLNPPQEKRGRP
jgi:hypothetical protein